MAEEYFTPTETTAGSSSSSARSSLGKWILRNRTVRTLVFGVAGMGAVIAGEGACAGTESDPVRAELNFRGEIDVDRARADESLFRSPEMLAAVKRRLADRILNGGLLDDGRGLKYFSRAEQFLFRKLATADVMNRGDGVDLRIEGTNDFLNILTNWDFTSNTAETTKPIIIIVKGSLDDQGRVVSKSEKIFKKFGYDAVMQGAPLTGVRRSI